MPLPWRRIIRHVCTQRESVTKSTNRFQQMSREFVTNTMTLPLRTIIYNFATNTQNAT